MNNPNLSSLPLATLQQAAQEARGLAMDAVAKAHSGHLGLPLGCAEVGAVLFSYGLRFDPHNPQWPNRDRFVLSAGHGSMFLYSWLHLSGYALSLEELKTFRQLHSLTPGHPEYGLTPGVECTTGPLGQGIGNAVGMALAGKMAAARFNTPQHSVFDHHVIALCGDGCMQEGVAAEASSYAGHLGLDNLILLYDANAVTLDAMASKTQSEDTALRYQAYGFDVSQVDGHDTVAFYTALMQAKASRNGKPKLIVLKTQIGRGLDAVAGSPKAHGEAGIPHIEEARKKLGLPQERFFVSQATRDFFAQRATERHQDYQAWVQTWEQWQAHNPEAAAHLNAKLSGQAADPQALSQAIAPFDPGAKLATRDAGGKTLQALAQALPLLLSGSADLHGSTKNYLAGLGDFERDTPTGRNLFFGIREHAMGAILNGIAYHGIFWPSGATFLTFSDYMRPAVRLAALSHLPVGFIWTHDSVGVGEDGPTHQPVETLSSLRLIPNLDVIRPADAEETAGAWLAAVTRAQGPTALILSRQALPMLPGVSPEARRQGTLRGGYILRREQAPLGAIVMATGSEVQHALAAAEQAGPHVRVVSMPCLERFASQDRAYQDSVLPPECRCRIAIEAGVTPLWQGYVGDQGCVIGIDRFGLSAPGDTVMRELGITAQAVLDALARYRLPQAPAPQAAP
jgi:transketolase